MARSTNSRRAGPVKAASKRKGAGPRRWLLRLLATLVLGAIGFAGWFWWDMRDWRPDPARYPEQGAVISSFTSGTRFETLKATGGAFVYLELAGANRTPDPNFASRLANAQAAGLGVGILYPFDPCLRADPQSGRFARMVPRDADLLPPAIALVPTASDCLPQVSDAAVESELMTLINQIETHAGKQVILKLGRDFEARHNVAQMIARDLWLTRDRARPDYAGRPWLLWSANSARVSEATEGTLEWVVVQQ